MSSSTVLKKVLPLIAILILIIVVAATCTAIRGKAKTVPTPDGYGETTYMEVTEGNFKYKIDLSTMYDELKKNFGLSTIVTSVDRQILKTEMLDGKSYYETITDEEVNEAYDEAVFPNDDKESLDADEIAEAYEDYAFEMYTSYGYRTNQEILDYHRLVLAKRLYATKKLAEEIKEQDAKAEADANNSSIAEDDKEDPYFTDEEIEEYYTANYSDSYWAIVLPFSTTTEWQNALAQLGYEYHAKDSSVSTDFNRWVKKGEEVFGTDADNKTTITGTLTVEETIKAFIDLYNTMYAYKTEGYPNAGTILQEGVHYTIDSETGKYSFNTEYKEDDEQNNWLYWTSDALSSFNSSLLTYLKTTAYSYNPEESTVDSSTKWFSINERAYGSIKYLVLKIAEVEAPEQDAVKAEIIEKLTEEALTETYINTKMAELRASKNFKLFDEELEESYISSMSSYDVTHDKNKESSETVVATIDGFEITANTLFETMDNMYGPAMVLSEITYQRFLANTDLNKYYIQENDEWTDRDKYKEILESISNLKLAFSSGSYSYYGYDPSSMTWQEFMQDVNGVKDENELKFYYLYGAVLDDEIAKFNNINKKDEDDETKYEINEDSELWKSYVEYMEKIVEKYYSVEGVHALIAVFDNALDMINTSNPVDQSEWTELQNELAKELHNQIITYIEDQTGTIQEKLQAIADAFKTAPRYVVGVDSQPVVEDMEYTFENIEVSRFKSAGLSVKYESLGAIDYVSGTSYAEEFAKVLKQMWDEDPDSSELRIYEDYLTTEFGYHIYCNLSSTPVPEWTDAPIFRVHENTETEEEANLAPYIEWKYVGQSEWVKLVDFSTASITLEDNKSLSFQISDDYVQYKYVDSSDSSYTDEWKNLISLEEAGIDTEKTAILPSLGLVRTYLDNSSDTNLTEAMKTAYTSFFEDLYNEMQGTTDFQIREYGYYTNLSIEFIGCKYNKDLFIETVDKTIERNKDNLNILYRDEPIISAE